MNKILTICCLLLTVLLLGFACPSATAAELVLLKRCVPSGPVVRLGDVADASAATTSQLDDLITTPLFPTPAPGTRRFLRRSEIRDLLISRGIDTRQLIFSGADFVEIGSSREKASFSPENGALPNVVRKELKATILEAIEKHLHSQAMQSKWKVELKIDESSYQRAAQLGSKLIASGGRKPWSGRQYFRLEDASGKQKEFVRVQARIIRSQSVIVARRAIPRGGLIRASDVEVRTQGGNIPDQAATELAQVIGKEASRSISANAFLLANQLRAPLLVKRGEAVDLFARTAGITIRTTAIAQENGSMGELIRIKTLDKKQQLSAQITGPSEVTVFATGARAADFAKLNRPSENRR